MGSDAVRRKMKRSTLAILFSTVLLSLFLSTSAAAQAEITGSWAARNHEVLAGDGFPVDFTGIPLNEEGRIRALSYSESQLSMVERQCQGWPAFYFVQGPFGLKIWSETDPLKGNVISYTIGGWEDRRAFHHLDGRPPASVQECGAHPRRLHDGKMGRHHPGRLHDAHEGRIPAQDRRTQQR